MLKCFSNIECIISGYIFLVYFCGIKLLSKDIIPFMIALILGQM